MGNGSKPYSYDPEVLKRFDQRRTIFRRIGGDPSALFYRQSVYSRSAEIVAREEAGRTRLGLEEAVASWTVHDYFRGAFGDSRLADADNVMDACEQSRYECPPPETMAAQIKAAALRMGACLAGVTAVNPLWVYSHNGKGQELELPQGVDRVLVMCVPMDREQIDTSPDYAASAATGRAYSMMAHVASSMAQMIRGLGYRATSCGNGTALSIPLAIDAGLGVMGRNGMLLTREFGPYVRICKVFTDLPLAVDVPPEENADDTCRKCGACARKCPVGAISKDEDPSYETRGISNNPGVLRWPVDAEKCYGFWIENGCDCSSCIAACPYGA